MSIERAEFWLAELRSPEFLRDAVSRFPEVARRARRAAVVALLRDGNVAAALTAEQEAEMVADREYWLPLRRELETLLHAARKQ